MSATFVTIVSTSYKVFDGTAYEDPRDLRGEFLYLDGGDAQSSLRTPKRQFACVVKLDPPSALDTLLADISDPVSGGPTEVTVTSPSDGLTRGATIQAYVFVGRAQCRTKGNGSNKTNTWSAPLAIREA